MPHSRRSIVLSTTAMVIGSMPISGLLAGCATNGAGGPALTPPIIFLHGNGDSAAFWMTTLWRFESNGWPSDRLFTLDQPFPLAREDDAVAQTGRSSTTEHRELLATAVAQVLRDTGADRCVLIGTSRGGNAIRNYIANGDGERTVSHAILAGTPNHGIWAIPGYEEGSEFSGTGAFLTALNHAPDGSGAEVRGADVRWLTIRSDRNDKYAQPTGEWIGLPGRPTFVTASGPELIGATNVVLPRADHRELASSPLAFDAMWRFLTGGPPATHSIVAEAHPVLQGTVTGRGLVGTDAASGDFPNNQPLPGAQVSIYATNTASGIRRGGAVYETTVGADGRWGPFTASPTATYEFVLTAAGYDTSHIYRSPFPRGSRFVHLRGERLAASDRPAGGAVVVFTRPRGYFDRSRDSLLLDGSAEMPGVPARGAGVSASVLRLPNARARTVAGRFNEERIAGRTWPADSGDVTVLELTY